MLTGAESQQLHKALLSAFTYEDLRQMLDFGLNVQLEAVGGGSNLNEIVFNLIKWAEAQGRTEDLIYAARNANPSNSDLRKFYEDYMQLKEIIKQGLAPE